MTHHLAITAGAVALLTAVGTGASIHSAAAPASAIHAADTGYVVAPTDSAAGAYLTIVGGCNDCHTPSWNENDGHTPDADRLTGNPVGYRGPWGTSYAANLRVLPPRMTEDRWVQVLTTADGGHGDPPMPWMNTRQMSQRDLRNLYRYVKSLGPKGERAPRMVPPDSEPKTPFILFVPQQPGSGIKITKDKP
jgi:cytochrome c1